MERQQNLTVSLEELLDLDEEVADHRWVTLSDLEAWIEKDKAEAASSSSGSYKDFCHETIVSLTELTISKLRELMTSDEKNVSLE